jgi:uncharacterized protein (TIGR01777 family)
MIALMQVFLTGATGFIGKAVVERLRADGHDVIAWVRDVARARRALGDVELVPLDRDPERLGDAVINLAGEQLIGRWSDAKKRAIVDSRVGLTKRLVDVIGKAGAKPTVLVSASGVGYYGDAGDAVLTESSPGGSDFLATLCRDWENAAHAAEAHGVRVVTLRFGVVLGRGGALSKMLPAFKAGVGGRIASGEHYMSWIHLDDLVELVMTVLADDRYRGAVNATSPNPVTNKELTKTLAGVLHRPAVFPVPAFALKLVFGEGGSVMTTGQRVIPARAAEHGFRHRHPELAGALSSILA